MPILSLSLLLSSGRVDLKVISMNLLLTLEVLQVLHTSKAEALIDAKHTKPVSLSNAVHSTTKEDIQFLKSLILGLRGKLPNEETTHGTEDSEEDVGTVFHRVKHVLGSKTNDEVEHPVSGSNNGDTTRPLTVGEDLLGQNPSDR